MSQETDLLVAMALRNDEYWPRWLTHCAYLSHDYELVYFGRTRDIDLASIDASLRQKNDKIPSNDAEFRDNFEKWIDTFNAELGLQTLAISARKKPTTRFPLGAGDDGCNLGQRDLGAHSKAPWQSREGFAKRDESVNVIGEKIVEMQGVRVAYGDNAVLGDWTQEHEGENKEGLWWDIRRGERWGIFGPNGRESWLSNRANLC